MSNDEKKRDELNEEDLTDVSGAGKPIGAGGGGGGGRGQDDGPEDPGGKPIGGGGGGGGGR